MGFFLINKDQEPVLASLKELNIKCGVKNFFKAMLLAGILWACAYLFAAFIDKFFETRFLHVDGSYELMQWYNFGRMFRYFLICLPFTLVISTLNNMVKLKGVSEGADTAIRVFVLTLGMILFMGIGALIFVPIFKTITHLPPYLGMLFGLAILWMTTEIISRKYEKSGHKLPTAVSTLEHIDTPTILFFLGILMAVSCLKVAGILGTLATGLNSAFGTEAPGFFFIDLIIGVLSSVVDNVPLVAASMGMYPLGDGAIFDVNHPFWEFLAYCAGTGGSLLIIGSAAGVAVMGMEKIDFIWYLKKISWLALAGYIAGALVFMLMDVTLFEEIEWLRNLA